MNGSLLQQLSLFDCFMSFFVLCFRILVLPFNPVVQHDDRELGAEEYFYNHISFTDFFYWLEIQRELRKRSRGCRAGVKR